MKIFVYSVIAVVAVSIIAGFFIVGSPQTERLRRFDDRRVSDLQNIQWQIVSFWQQKERLPESLDELADDISGWTAPKDPQTLKSYQYSKGEDLSFELCADFVLESEDDKSSIESSLYPSAFDGFGKLENWAHPKGQHCFERKIDPERYPPFQKPAR